MTQQESKEKQVEKAKQFSTQIRVLEEEYQIYLCGNKIGNVEFRDKSTSDLLWTLAQTRLVNDTAGNERIL